MKAARITAPTSVAIEDIEPPAPGPGDVRIRVAGCGVCGSNLPLWLGRPWFHYPLPAGAPGHEPWGRVEAVGEDVDGLRPGDHVAALADQAFAEYVVTGASRVVRLPEALDQTPMPAEPLACAVNVVRRARLEPGDRVAVVGVGFLGAVVIALAREAGAEVWAWSRRAYAREMAARAGATAVFPLDATAPNAAPFDCAIEAAGEQRTLDVAASLVATRGRLVIAGYHQDGPRLVDMQSWNWRGLDVINAHERDESAYVDGMRRAIDLIAAGRLDPRPFYTHVLPLEAIGEAMRLSVERPDGFLKALVVA
jgi:2-desacetyl-2-hydroxyethyl bacteriochlorophyllide A dehydrogenase